MYISGWPSALKPFRSNLPSICNHHSQLKKEAVPTAPKMCLFPDKAHLFRFTLGMQIASLWPSDATPPRRLQKPAIERSR